MPRHHTVANAGGQVDIPFTPEEESDRDAEEVLNEAIAADKKSKRAVLDGLHDKLAADTITDVEIREMLRMERGI